MNEFTPAELVVGAFFFVVLTALLTALRFHLDEIEKLKKRLEASEILRKQWQELTRAGGNNDIHGIWRHAADGTRIEVRRTRTHRYRVWAAGRMEAELENQPEAVAMADALAGLRGGWA